MAAIVVKGFNGLKPIADPLLLGNGEAQVANNVFLTSGALRPLKALTTLKSTAKSVPLTIYRFDPEGNQGEASYWLEFQNDTDVMRSPVALDQWKRLYWTDGENIPKYAPAANVIIPAGDGSLPGHGYDLGVPKPTTKPTVTSSTAVVETETLTKTYLLTYYNATTSKESTPSRTFSVRSLDGLEVKITGLPTDNKGDTGITDKRLYREVPDPSPATTKVFRRIATIPLAETDYTDTTTDAAAAALPALPAGIAGAPPSPVSYPIVGAATTTALTARARAYSYTIGFIDVSGTKYDESAPSPAVNISLDDTQKVTISGLVNSNGGQYFRIYRADDNKTTALLVKQIPVNQVSYQDDLSLTNNLGGQVGVYAPAATAPPAPTVGSATASTAGNLLKRLYMITFVDDAAHESGKSPVSEIVQVIDGVTAVNIYHGEPIPTGVTKKRLYRQDISLSSGIIVANDANWKFVAENSASATNAVDNIATASLPGGTLPAALQGIPPTPTTLPTTTSTVPASEIPDSRVYCYTLVTAYDEEGPPSDSSDVISVDPSKPVTLTIPLPPSGNYNFAKKYVYRSSTGTAKTKFMFCGEIPAATTTFTDTKKTAELETILPSQTWIPPPVGLKGLRLMANGAAVGFKENTLYFSEPNRPHAWPHTYPIDELIVGIGVFGQTVAVLTPGFPHLFQGVDPMAMSDTKMLLPQACVNKRGIVETGDGVMYPSPDGLVMIGNGVSVVTQQIMSREIWQSYWPEAMECFVYNGRIIITYNTGAKRGVLLFDLTGQGAVFTTSDINAATPIVGGYYSPERDILYFSRISDIVRFDDGAMLQATWKSKKYRQTQHENFGFGIVLAKAYNPNPTAKFFADGVLKHTKVLTGLDQFRLPAGFKALDWEVQLECSVEVTEFAVATSSFELQAT